MNPLGSTTIGILEPGCVASTAEETHFKDLQEFHKKLDQFQQIETMKRAAIELKIQKQFAGIDKKFEHVTNTLAEIKLQLLNLGKVSGSSDNSVLSCYDLSSGVDKSGNYVHTPLPRFDFPRFDGSNPRAWFLRCNTYFQLMPNIPDVQKIILATKHFDGKALTWHQNFNMGEIEITWEQFLEVVSARFEDVKVTNIFMELNKLKQNDGTYDDYVERFEELRACLMLNDSNKSYEDYFVASFLSGLSEELRSFINMFQPRTLHQAIELGKKQLVTLNAISKELQPTDEGEILEAQKAMEFGFSEVEINTAQIVEEVQDSIHPMFGEEGFTTMRVIGKVENHKLNFLLDTESIPSFLQEAMAQKFGYDLILEKKWLKFCTPIKLGYINMIFTTFLNGKKVKFKFLTTTPITRSVLCSSMHQINEIEGIGVLKGKGVKLKTLTTAIDGTEPPGSNLTHEEINDMEISVLNTEETYMCCKGSINLRQWLKWLQAIFGFHTLHLSLDFYLNFSNTETSKLMTPIQKLVQLLKENSIQAQQRQKHALVQNLLEMTDGENYKIEPFATLGLSLLTKKGEHTSAIWIHWLDAGLEFATLKDENCICRKLPSLDPRGRGSSAAGGIVMAYVGVNGGGDGVKEKGWSLEFDLEEKLESGADLGKKRDQKERKKISWATDYCYWTIHKLMGGWSVAVGLVEI